MIYGIHLNSFKTLKDAIMETHKLKCNNLQVFFGSKILTTLSDKFNPSKEEILEIRKLLKEYKIDLYCHGILTLNYCNYPYSKKYEWGLTNLIYDMNLLHKLGGKACIIHAGRYNTKRYQITKQECYKNYINSLKHVIDNTKVVKIYIETPATKKNTIINTLEEFSILYNKIPKNYQKRIKICVDTCHIYVSGYNISTKEGVSEYFSKFNNLIGLKNLKLIHLNDSFGELNSHLNRHAPIGKGYIFKKSKEGLKEIVRICKKNKIPFILETNPNSFDKNLKIIKKEVNLKGGSNKYQLFKQFCVLPMNNVVLNGGDKKKDKKKLILKIFEDILDYYKTLNTNKTKQFKIDSTEKIIKELKKLNKIESIEKLKNINSIGKKSLDKIDIILKTNKLPQHENIKKNLNKINKMKNFQKIYGIGPKFSKKLLNNGVKNIKNLKEKVNLKKVHLTNVQKISLDYYNNLTERIPKEEIKKLTVLLKNIIKKEGIKCELLNAGSYVMGKKDSGDIDIIIVFESKNYNYVQIKKLIKGILLKYELFIYNLLDGQEKDIYLVKFLDRIRQLDIGFVKNEHKYYYILYFSSSKEFSKKIRKLASEKGYKLNEKGLFYKKNGKRVNLKPKSEKDIFEFLKLNYVYPKNRLI
tara:strand:+ start:4241 stop:6160 length:1920 start_codon:yes stop_codon:yes gene_type:complete